MNSGQGICPLFKLVGAVFDRQLYEFINNTQLLKHSLQVGGHQVVLHTLTLYRYLHIIRLIEYINAENGISRTIIAAREERSPAESLFTVRDGLNLRPGAGMLKYSRCIR